MTDELRLVSEMSGDIYLDKNGSKVSVIKIADDVLMTSKQMAKIYGVSVPTICKKLKKYFYDTGISEKQVSSIFTHRADDGKLYRTTFYNSQVIIAIGTMLKSPEAKQFQKWLEGNSLNKLC